VLEALTERGKSTDDVPIMVSVTIETTGTMLLGTEIAAAATALAQYPICSLGLNCATGPTEMAEHIHWLGKNWRGMNGAPGGSPLRGVRGISVIPNAGLPILVEGRTEYPLKPEPFVEALVKYVEQDGVGIVGGCCGTTPEHIRQLVEAVGKKTRGQRPEATVQAPKAGVTSLYSVQDYRQDTSIMIVGERMNSSGSRAFKKLLEAKTGTASCRSRASRCGTTGRTFSM